jgi:hypothetical protein
VLPFQNMSGDPEQEYFVDGMVEDISPASLGSSGCSSSRGIQASPTGARPSISGRSGANSGCVMCWKGACAKRAIACASRGN